MPDPSRLAPTRLDLVQISPPRARKGETTGNLETALTEVGTRLIEASARLAETADNISRRKIDIEEVAKSLLSASWSLAAAGEILAGPAPGDRPPLPPVAREAAL